MVLVIRYRWQFDRIAAIEEDIIDMIKAVVFDLGGTLMEYKGMPLNWEEYYYQGFQNVDRKNKLDLSEEDMLEAIKVLKAYNPRNVSDMRI